MNVRQMPAYVEYCAEFGTFSLSQSCSNCSACSIFLIAVESTEAECISAVWEMTANDLSGVALPGAIVHERTIWIADAHRDDGKRLAVAGGCKVNALLKLNRRFGHR